MIHHRRHCWLFGAALICVTAFCVTRSTFAQAPSSAPKVFRFSQPEISDPPKRNVVRTSTEKPQQELGSQEGGASNVGPAVSGPKDSLDAPPRPSSPAVTRFGPSRRITERPATEVLEFIDARPVVPQWVDSRPIKNVPVRVSPGMKARRVVDDGSQLESLEDAPEPLRQEGDEWEAVQPLPEENSAVADAEFAVANRQFSKVPRQLPRAASVRATSHTRSMPTADERRTLPSAHRSGEVVAATPTPAEEAESTQPTIDDEESPTTAEADVKDMAGRDSKNSPSVAITSLAPNAMQWIDRLLIALLSGFVLLMGVLACVVIFSLLKFGRQRDATVKVDIINNGPGSGMAGSAPGYSQTVTRYDSQPDNHINSPHRAPTDWQPAPSADWPSVATTLSPTAAPVNGTSGTEFARTAAKANSQPAVLPPAPQIAPVYAAKKQRDEVLKQQQEEAVVRQIVEQNIGLRQKINSQQGRAA